MDKESRRLFWYVRKSENLIIRFVIKTIIVLFALAIQIGVFWLLITTTGYVYNYQFVIYYAIRVFFVLYLLYHHDSAKYKLAWVLFIMFMPILGITIYFLFGNSRLKKKKQIEIKQIENDTNYLLDDSYEVDNELKENDRLTYNMFEYIKNITSYPISENINCKYYDLGEKMFKDLENDILNAKHYIFLEYYIIDKGVLTDRIFKILKQKAKEGVEVKIIYDSFGSLGKFKKKDIEDLTLANIKVYTFNPMSIWLNSFLNNRMHRKIAVIDGKISYTGGVNLADEYVNLKNKFGHWKDVGVRFEGDISWNFTLIFLRDLKFIDRKLDIPYDKYKKISKENIDKTKDTHGLVTCLSDGPNNRKNPVEAVYMHVINTAKEYVYITTPYLAVSEEMLTSILNAARSGKDVRIILPHVPDKKIVQDVARSYYEVLLNAGVKVYEYAPGFIHSKTIVSDDKISCIGSSNMDYRSMNLNYECISVTYNTGIETDVKKDFLNMTNSSCIKIQYKDWISRPLIKKIIEAILTTFSLMF